MNRLTVTAGGDSSHRADHPVAGQSKQELPASKLRSTIAVNHTTGDISAHRDGVAQRVHGQAGLHPRVDRVPDDLVREHVFDRAEIKFALCGGPVFGNVCQPQLVRRIGGEPVSDTTILVRDSAEIIMNRRSRLFTVPAALFTERTPPSVVTADSPRSPIRHQLPGLTGLVREETVPELWVIVVGIKQRVRAMGLHDLAIGGGVE